VTHPDIADGELLIAANHGQLAAEIGRWLVHDIRGPLQGVTLTLALLAEPDAPPFDAGLRDALAGASEEFGSVVDLVDRLLRMPRLRNGLEPVVVADALRDAERFFARRRVRLETVWPAPTVVAALPAVSAGADHLLHLLLSLLLAAIRAAGDAPAGRVVVEAADRGDSVELTLTATPPDGADPGRHPPNLELALAGSRALLDRIGGQLLVTDAGIGTAFTVRLPVWRRRGGE
jgi:signal transduction histidine kinase